LIPEAKWWSNWLNELVHLESVDIPRCFKPPCFGNVKRVEIHNFADASRCAYSAVTYLRFVSEIGKIHCSF